MEEHKLTGLKDELNVLKVHLQKHMRSTRMTYSEITHRPKISVLREYPVEIKVTVTDSKPSNNSCNILYLVDTCLQNQATREESHHSHLLLVNVVDSVEIIVEPFATYKIKNKVYPIEFANGECMFQQPVAQKCIKSHPEVFSIKDLEKLERMARNFTEQEPGRLQTISYFYRNKPPEYYEDILQERNGLMEPYIKDLNGDPRCPSNGCIKGLYFMGRPYKTSSTKLPTCSPFGRRRFIIPVHRLFNWQYNLYFSDFWCHHQKHYVSLVLTKHGSTTDDFCRQYLLKLDKCNNSYLELQTDGKVRISTAVWVEILYTEPIDISKECDLYGAKMKNTHVIGRGRSKRLGMPKKKDCPICNLR